LYFVCSEEAALGNTASVNWATLRRQHFVLAKVPGKITFL
jgi:hypothetical protein